MSEDPLEQARWFIAFGLPSSGKRVAEIRKKFSRLMFISHNYGAGGIKDSERYIVYRDVVKMCVEHARDAVERSKTQ